MKYIQLSLFKDRDMLPVDMVDISNQQLKSIINSTAYEVAELTENDINIVLSDININYIIYNNGILNSEYYITHKVEEIISNNCYSKGYYSERQYRKLINVFKKASKEVFTTISKNKKRWFIAHK